MRRVTLLAYIFAPLLMLAVAASALGGTYQELACGQAPNSANNSWQVFNSDPTHLSNGQVCPPQAGSGESVKSTGMFATDALGSSGTAPDGAVVGFRSSAPAGVTIVGLQDDRYLGAYADNGWKPFVKADSTVLETCTFAFPEESCSVGASFGSGSLNGPLPINEASTLTVGIECTALGGCTTGSTLHRAWAALYGARVTLKEQAPPSITGLGGSLWGAGTAGGFHRGSEQVSFQASDLTGIAKATISIDGSVVATEEGVCDYTQPLPCQPLSPAFQVDTTQLTDGAHTVAVDAFNAANNNTRLTEQIVVVNQPPLSPVALKAAAQADGSFVVSWSDPAHVAPIAGAVYQLCPAGGAVCGSPVAVGDGPFALPASAAGESVRVWLVDVAGNSSSGNAASVTLTGASGPGAGTPGPGTVGVTHLPVLRVRHHVRGRRLTVIALVPKGVRGPVHFSVRLLRGKTCVAMLSGRAKVKRGRAEVVFVLPRVIRRPAQLVLKVSAQGATAGTLLVALRRRSPRRAHG